MKLTICILALLSVIPVFAKSTENEERFADSVDVLKAATGEAGGIPNDLINKAYCVVVVPGLKHGGFIVGARYGKGYVSCRKQNGNGWTAPGTVIVEGGSFGFQIGAAENDVLMFIMNKKGMQDLFRTKFTLGGDASVAGGPVGRSASADTSGFLAAEIITWSRSHGLFAGVALKGATLRPDEENNKDLYGKSLTNREILEGNVMVPAVARPFVDLLDKYSPAKEGSSSTH